MHACNRPNSISRVLQHSIQCVHKTTKSHGALYTSIKAWQPAIHQGATFPLHYFSRWFDFLCFHSFCFCCSLRHILYVTFFCIQMYKLHLFVLFCYIQTHYQFNLLNYFQGEHFVGRSVLCVITKYNLTCLIIFRESTLWDGPSCVWSQNMFK